MNKRTKQVLTLLLFALTLILSSCEEKAENPVKPEPDGEALNSFIDENIEEHTQHFTIDATAGGNIKGAHGTIIQFYAGSFLNSSDGIVSGTVDIELIEIYSRSSMLLTQKPTQGKKDDGDLAMLISGGEFYVNATQNGNPLKPAVGYYIIAPTENTGGPDNEMKVFTGVEECGGDSCNVVWVEEKDRGLEVGLFQDNGGAFSAYYAFQKHFGWTNIDRWYNDPRPKTTIFVDVPEGFDNTNCAVFITYDGEPTALGRFDTYNDETGLFSEHYGLIPIGLKVHFILVSIIDNEVHYAIQEAVISENHVEVITEVKSISEEDLIDLIGDLP